jgi:hypothetical protein
MLELRFNVPFFQRGEFPPVVQNGSDYIELKNPWVNGTVSAPFDQSALVFFDGARAWLLTRDVCRVLSDFERRGWRD